MKRSLLKKTEPFRLLSVLLVTLCCFATARALESDDINAAILVDGSVPVRWTNDAEHPWYEAEDSEGSYMRTPETDSDRSLTSTLTFTYTSSYPTEISFLWKIRAYNSADLSVSLDGEKVGTASPGDWNPTIDTRYYFNGLMAPAGSHTVQITSVSNNRDYYDENFFSGIRKLCIRECKELESACLKEGSLPLTFENESDLDKIWITDDGYIRSSNFKSSVDNTRIKTTFTIDRPSVFSYEMKIEKTGLSTHWNRSGTIVYVDGRRYDEINGNTEGYAYNSVVLYPGSHTVEFECWQNDWCGHLTELRNVCLDQSWYEARLNAPGELRTRLLQALNGKNFQDAELVKISGSMNEDDWSIIKQLTNVKAIDLTDTDVAEMPKDGCRDLAHLSTVMLPSTLTAIGDYAFYGTHLYSITIPAGVERIGEGIARYTKLRYVDFEDNSRLKYMGYVAFADTDITEFKMPDSVELCGLGDDRTSGLLYNCRSLRKLHLSEGLSCVPYNIARDCTSLEEVNIPEKAVSIEPHAFANTAIRSIRIPKDVQTIDRYAFSYCDSLKDVVLNSLCWNMEHTFYYSHSIENIVLPCATPPSIIYDPFEGLDKDKVRLVVPDFAFDTYRSDPYWYQFSRNTFTDEEASLNDYWGIRGELLLDTRHVMQGTPSLEVFPGGSITFDNDTPQGFNEITFNTSESTPASLLSRSNSVTANSLVTKFQIEEPNRWYFFSPLTDVRMSDVTYSSTDSWIIHYYDGAHRASENTTSDNWVKVPADGILKRGQGYIFQSLEPGCLTLPAMSGEQAKFLGNDEVTFELEDNACETPENAGWNFVANPYPCYYDIYYIGMEAPVTVWDGRTYRAYSLSDGDRGDNTLVLRPMQPFFIQKASADLTACMTLTGRRTSNVIDRTQAPKATVTDEIRHKLNLELYSDDSETADDYTRVVLNENASMGYEAVHDASKFMTINSDVAQLYTLGGNRIPMAINERPYEDGNVTLGVLLPASGRTYRIAASRADRKAWLHDAETGIEQDLTEGDYIFTASKTGIDNRRFSIRFAPASNAVEGVVNGDVKVTGNAGSITVEAPAGSAVAVYAADGSVIANTTSVNGILEITTDCGVFVVVVNGVTYKTIVK